MITVQQFIDSYKQRKEILEKPFPLKYLLMLYSRGNLDDVYCSRFEGFKLLVQWLQPIEIPTVTECSGSSIYEPLYTYVQQEIARILQCSPVIIQHTFMELANDYNSRNRSKNP